jgi:TfoX/Sxy family transcriptional regulator of competence genes
MAYDEGLAQRIRGVFTDREDVIEKKMFGGLAFMVRGHMCCGVSGDDLMLRVGPDQYNEALAQPHARPMDFTGRPMKGFVYVDQAGLDSDDDLEAWIGRGLTFVLALPPK